MVEASMRGVLENEEDGVIRLELRSVETDMGSTRCLIEKVLSNKPFNAFGFLESMKRAMAPARGFTAKKIDKNLFPFQFIMEVDMRSVLNREPWHFEKTVVMLKELGRGEQPSTLVFGKAAF
ncbi:hypothetical protein ACS0TY_006136 [Phlomoides rotata]